ncbi:hypothetical protein [Crocosphaera chwakensis]|uniref:Uncharacterized protein n=1 Tax=Crocosphaera chwakensis CCY0110 TaxID=391612 RepID=A3IVF2_9CHRO|nr:hypothetical protein [Crocosphaera chwakensis]EAZ89524.1 hypothetical protein CY0110_09146 [Crocosphaera chwakensis CCY0110]
MITSGAKTTNNVVILETHGYELKFYFDFSENIENYLVKTEIQFLTKAEFLQRVFVKSPKFIMRLDDLNRLSQYLKDHIKILETNPDHESYTFVDYSLTYQIQALCGEVSSNINASYFSICSMVNIGRTNPLNTSTYVGGESTINFNQVENFITSSETLLSSH